MIARQVGKVPTMVRVLMAARDKSLNDVAKALGVTKSSASERLTGKTRISADEIEVLAAYFEVDAGIFFKTPEEVIEGLGPSRSP